MVHAFRNALRSFDVDEGLTLLIGGDRSGGLLEIGVVDRNGPTIVHAMPARERFLR